MKSKILVLLFLMIKTAYGQDLGYGGTYSYGTTPENGRTGVIYVYPNSDSTLLFYLELNRGAPSYNSGAIVGQMNIESLGKANFTMIKENENINCSMNFRFTNDSLYIRTNDQADDCGYGHAIYSKGDFKRTNKEIPKFFFDRDEGKTCFKDLNWKKWWGRD